MISSEYAETVHQYKTVIESHTWTTPTLGPALWEMMFIRGGGKREEGGGRREEGGGRREKGGGRRKEGGGG